MHVLALGNLEAVSNEMLGAGISPSGGIVEAPAIRKSKCNVEPSWHQLRWKNL